MAVVNKGTDAGGSRTTENGLPYEEMTNLKTEYKILSSTKYHDSIQFGTNEKIFKATKKTGLFKTMDEAIDKRIAKAHSCKNPDECFIDDVAKKMFILEKKFQQVRGSICEKIQTPDFKLWQYRRTFPRYDIVYIYCLSEWFRENCKAELEYLEYKRIPVFWGNDADYKQKVIAFITNYYNITNCQ